jgi:hypothetical protein
MLGSDERHAICEVLVVWECPNGGAEGEGNSRASGVYGTMRFSMPLNRTWEIQSRVERTLSLGAKANATVHDNIIISHRRIEGHGRDRPQIFALAPTHANDPFFEPGRWVLMGKDPASFAWRI